MAEPTTPVTPAANTASPVQEKKKGNGLKIVIIVLVVLLFLCALCGGGSYLLARNAATDFQGRVQNEIDKNGNSIKDQITNSVKDSVSDAVESAGSSATSKLYGNAKLPDGFPTSSVLLASDYEVLTSSTSEESGKASYTVSYYSAMTVDQLVSVYKNDMLDKGWTLKSSGNILGFNSVVLSNTEATLSVVVNGSISSKEPRNMVTLIYTEK